MTGLNRAEFLKLCGAGLVVAGSDLPSAGWGRERMTTRPIPSSGEALPVVGLGTWQAFDVGAPAEERKPLAEVLRLLFEAGGTMIDSSPMYGRPRGSLAICCTMRERAKRRFWRPRCGPRAAIKISRRWRNRSGFCGPKK
jgi:aryl-alcohol dehydrogenase-like predicted oxidoreductase